MKRSIAHVLVLAVSLAGACFVLESCTEINGPSGSAGTFNGGGGGGGTVHRQELVPAPVAAANASLGTARPSSCNLPGVQYPRIEPDGKVTFRFNAPQAQKVQVSIN